MNRRRLLTLCIVAAVIVGAALLVVQQASADQLADAIAKTPVGTEKGMINPEASKGFLGIPGAPHSNLIIGFLWAIWVGWIFSTVGAFGGIMAGVGHMTVFGLGDYARTFKKTSPVLNKLITDSIRVSNQWLVGLSAAISTTNYYRMGRLVAPLGIALAIGGVSGSLLIPWFTAGKIKLSQYMGYFGLCVFLIGGFLFYETTPRGQSRKKEAKAAAQAFEKSMKEKKATRAETAALGVKITSFRFTRISFTFYGVEFSFNPLYPVLGGLFIAALASFLGIGGGFLYVPFITSVVGLPMYLVAGTSALTVLVGMVVSIFGYMVLKGAVVSWGLIGAELVGIFVGSMIGPRTSKYIPDIWLKRLFVVLAIYVGLRYFSQGFFGQTWVPPY
jgi:uncharacterized membrane protein YfcA